MNPNFEKYSNGLMPAIIQDNNTRQVLMLGYMNEEAFKKTKLEKKVTFFSRSKNRLWTKGEESGNFLKLIDILIDCDKDTLLIKVEPISVVCHNGWDTCFNEKNTNQDFIMELEAVIDERRLSRSNKSYVASLFNKGINKIAQKVGEETVELIIESKDNNDSLFVEEAADLLFHYVILLKAKNLQFNDVITVLKGRNKGS